MDDWPGKEGQRDAVDCDFLPGGLFEVGDDLRAVAIEVKPITQMPITIRRRAILRRVGMRTPELFREIGFERLNCTPSELVTCSVRNTYMHPICLHLQFAKTSAEA